MRGQRLKVKGQSLNNSSLLTLNSFSLISHFLTLKIKMRKLVKGLREFKANYYSTHRELFEQLSHGQKPRVLFITCSDSRVDPNLITQAGVGELFVIRNAGNIIPPYGATNGGEGATIEYAVQALGINQIIICGHSHCGAMKGLLKLNKLQSDMPLVFDWLKYAEATRRLVLDHYSHYEGEDLLEIMVAENVLTQIDNLRTYPVIHSKLYQKQLNIYAWIYHIETGEVLAYDPVNHAYISPQSQVNEFEPEEEVEPVNNISYGDLGFPMTRLSREQMNRIYQGSKGVN